MISFLSFLTILKKAIHDFLFKNCSPHKKIEILSMSDSEYTSVSPCETTTLKFFF